MLLELLGAAYDAMTHDQRQVVFGPHAETLPPAREDGETLLEEIELFHSQSYAKAYYAPFRINSKNFMHIPEETNQWFEQLGDFLEASCKLTAQGDHLHAVSCFDLLYELITSIDYGDEIVFAHELGSWMIPANEQDFQNAYLISLAATATPLEFTEKAVYLIQRDGMHSFAYHAYVSALDVASTEQREHLDATLQEKKIQTQRNRL